MTVIFPLKPAGKRAGWRTGRVPGTGRRGVGAHRGPVTC